MELKFRKQRMLKEVVCSLGNFKCSKPLKGFRKGVTWIVVVEKKWII